MLVLLARVFRLLIVGFSLVTSVGCSIIADVPQNNTPSGVPVGEPDENTATAAVVPEEPVNCPIAEPIPAVPAKPLSCPKPVQCPLYLDGAATDSGEIAIVGRVEYVDVMSIPIRKKARIDTGAETSSIDATDIIEFERDGNKWVRFQVTDRATDDVFEVKAPVVRSVLIKQHGVDNVRRQVVELDLRMGAIRETVEVTLADRERFDFPLLIGRNFLQGRAVVDVSRKYLMLNKETGSQSVSSN